MATGHDAEGGTNRPASRGFTLIELIVVIAIVSILAGALVPIVLRPYAAQRMGETARELGALELAVLGQPEAGDFGFLGTVGRPPATLAELLAPGTIPVASFGQGGVPVGWNGPYLRVNTAAPLADGWGVAYAIEYDTVDTKLWRLRSAGQDRVSDTADDSVLPSATAWYGSTGALSLTLESVRGDVRVPLDDSYVASVELFWPSAGVQLCTGANTLGCPGTCTLTNGRCTFSKADIPFGLRAVRVTLTNTSPCPNCAFVRTVQVVRAVNAASLTIPLPLDPHTLLGYSCAPALATNAVIGPAPGMASLCATDLSVLIPPDSLLMATASGGLRSSLPGSSCYFGISIDGQPVLADLVANGGQGFNVTRTDSDTTSPATTTRLADLAEGTHTVNYFIAGPGAQTCTLEGSALQVMVVKK